MSPQENADTINARGAGGDTPHSSQAGAHPQTLATEIKLTLQCSIPNLLAQSPFRTKDQISYLRPTPPQQLTDRVPTADCHCHPANSRGRVSILSPAPRTASRAPRS